MECIRKEAEGADFMQGFEITHAIGGGTGSGFGCLLLDKLEDDYPNSMITSD